MKQDRLDLGPNEEGDDVLGAAFRAVREIHDGAIAEGEADATLHRALFRARSGVRRQRFARWIVLPAAAVLVASTAWAGVTGRLAPAVRAVLDVVHAEPRPLERPASPVAASAPSAAPQASVAEALPSASAEAAPIPESAREPAPLAPSVALAPAVAPASVAVAPPARLVTPPASTGTTKVAAPAAMPSPPPSLPPSSSPSPDSPSPAPPVASADPHAALFAEAHRIHFTERDPGRALAAWDRYLAVEPNGRLAPEARYNRALALVRVGRKNDAQQELAAFANGMYGSYRREEAKALLDALGRDAAARP